MDGVKFYVVGGGPAGFSLACLAAKKGAIVTVFEGRQNIWAPSSHLLGLNQRGQKTFEEIRPGMVADLHGEVVDAFVITNRGKELARYKSGHVIGTTRDDVNGLLYEEAKKMSNITVKLGHKMKSVDMEKKMLTFVSIDSQGNQTDVTFDASDGYLIAADGVWSSTRRSITSQIPDIAPEELPWGFTVRVLYTKPGVDPDGLHKGDHIVFGDARMYAAYVKGRWLMGFTVLPGSDTYNMLSATEATEQNIEAMKDYIARTCKPFVNAVTDEELRNFFESRDFGGSVLRPKTLVVGEWVAMVGDAAHSVIPLTGEGVNSSLEDALKFVTSFEASMATKPKEEATPLADYNESRLPDIIALADYAFHCANKGASASALDRTASTMVDIMLSLGKKYGIVKYIRDDYSNGVMAPLRVPYREVIGLWKRQYYFLFPICRWIASWFVSSTPKQS